MNDLEVIIDNQRIIMEALQALLITNDDAHFEKLHERLDFLEKRSKERWRRR